MTENEINQMLLAFEPHPISDAQMNEVRTVRAAHSFVARAIIEACPPSADRTAALRKLRESCWTAVASITHDSVPPLR